MGHPKVVNTIDYSSRKHQSSSLHTDGAVVKENSTCRLTMSFFHKISTETDCTTKILSRKSTIDAHRKEVKASIPRPKTSLSVNVDMTKPLT
jgi:hypothetical protein